jgi:anhydro-N-acetylmuramic acid kinase
MSGTSLDGADGVLARIDDSGHLQVLAHDFVPFDATFRSELLALNQSGPDELHRSALVGNAIARHYAEVVGVLLQKTGLQTAQVNAIGAHGQTVRHRPLEFDADEARHRPAVGYTLQLINPALLAELTGIDVVADFRSRDLAAGGQGAPLVPAFHQGVFAQPGRCVAVLNIGGIANLSVLKADGSVLGWDCGPGNALMDFWCARHTGQVFDSNGAWAASGQLHPELLYSLASERFLQKSPPKSTGRDLFNPAWLLHHLAAFEDLGLPPLQVEAAAFAWLAFKNVRRETSSLPSVTGARGARVLGAIYPR